MASKDESHVKCVMTLAPETQAILDSIADVSGKPIQFLPDAHLPVLSRITRARGNAPSHILTYRPDATGLDYVVAFEATFTLRIYQTPESERYDFAGNDKGRAAVRKMLSEPGGVVKKMGLPLATADALASQFYDGLMTQLRSMPIGIRIDEWIHETYPGLRAAQRASIDAQQRQNAQVLSPQIRQMAPPTIYNPNVAMNAAYARFADRLLENPAYSVPYHSAGFLEGGEKLLAIMESIPSDAVHDRALVDAWAEELGINDWVQWLPITDAG
jgi:hypothetical protein